MSPVPAEICAENNDRISGNGRYDVFSIRAHTQQYVDPDRIGFSYKIE